jgi:hypothetical protein
MPKHEDGSILSKLQSQENRNFGQWCHLIFANWCVFSLLPFIVWFVCNLNLSAPGTQSCLRVMPLPVKIIGVILGFSALIGSIYIFDPNDPRNNSGY